MKRSIVMELTPLLDVILILLFLVLTSVSTQVETVQATAQQEAQAAEKEIAALRLQRDDAAARQTKAEQALTSFALVDKSCRIVTLSIAENGAGRLLTVTDDGQEATSIPLTWDETAYERNSLHAALRRAAVIAPNGTEQAVFFVFQYDRSQIYQRDYLLVHDALLRCSGENVYFAEYDMTEFG